MNPWGWTEEDGPTMSVYQQELLQSYVDKLAPLVGLHGWRIHVVSEPSNSMVSDFGRNPDDPFTFYAYNHKTQGSRDSHIWFSEEFFEDSAEEQRATVVHELLHCHFKPVETLIREGLKPVIPSYSTRQVIEQWWYDADEYAIDDIAHAFSVHLPLPPALPFLTPKEQARLERAQKVSVPRVRKS